MRVYCVLETHQHRGFTTESTYAVCSTKEIADEVARQACVKNMDTEVKPWTVDQIRGCLPLKQSGEA